MEDAEGGAEIRQTMEALPPDETQLPHGAVRRGERQRDEEHPGGEAYIDELALYDIGENGVEAEVLVESDVGADVQAGVEEGEEAQHPPDADRPRPVGEHAQRRERQRGDEEGQ